MMSGSVLSADDWSDADVDLSLSLQQDEIAVNSQRASLNVEQFNQQPQLHFHLHVQVYLTTSMLIILSRMNESVNE